MPSRPSVSASAPLSSAPSDTAGRSAAARPAPLRARWACALRPCGSCCSAGFFFGYRIARGSQTSKPPHAGTFRTTRGYLSQGRSVCWRRPGSTAGAAPTARSRLSRARGSMRRTLVPPPLSGASRRRRGYPPPLARRPRAPRSAPGSLRRPVPSLPAPVLGAPSAPASARLLAARLLRAVVLGALPPPRGIPRWGLAPVPGCARLAGLKRLPVRN